MADHAAAPSFQQAVAVDTVASLEQLLSHNARRNPDLPGLLDPPDRVNFTDGEPRRLTFAQLDRVVSAGAQRLQELGLPASSVVGVQLPNIGEAIVMLLAAMRAGLIPALLPLRWREADIVAALRSADAAALVTCRRIGAVEHAHIALAVAVEVTSIRYLCGFGPALPDGFVPLDDVFDADAPIGNAHATSSPCPVAVITFDAARDPVPFARSHIELFAGGLAVMMEARLQRRAAILSTILAGSFAGLATAVVPWLLTGGALTLHHPFNPERLADQLESDAVDTVVIPGAILNHMLADFRMQKWAQQHTVLALCRPPAQPAVTVERAHRIVDVTALGEWAIVPMLRGPAHNATALTPGAWTPSNAAVGTPALVQIGKTLHQTVAVGGAMTPRAPFPADVQSFRYGNDGLIDTGIAWPLDIKLEHGGKRALPLETLTDSDHIEGLRASVA
jgi:hypothetical protein